ncbi:hypothetical protein SAMN05216429_10446 [Marinobacter persicus]|uniref:HEPN domain-containing protein n=1 Tax=Marinobacter persicus TaxID=930118 RepID=A0A1I3STV9_9GAMM|nr:hypothetical protein [Marinobacter persicus]GHD41146.1 hypothetical protein GCM10008110_02840 [Marinobacter persicus]SFJ60837.1 hypothetical protein SAMN05216429_10446 [Marinobacter persicus]
MEALDNLVKIHRLKIEKPDKKEFEGMLRAADTKLRDASLEGLSPDSQFSLAYGAAHALSLAALRWHGYRSESRYIVFQCLQHTVGLSNGKWRVLDKCHSARNLAEYEGQVDVNPQLLKELIVITRELQKLVEALPPIRD